MKKILLILVIAAAFLTSCTTTAPIKKSVAYKGMYDEKPIAILLMPPINRSTNVESKEYFHSTLNVPIANAGYYVIPTFLSMEILKRESAYDAELFLNSPSLSLFGEVFGADMALFTIIHKWDKSALGGKVMVEVEYIFKSIKTNEIIYTRKGEVAYDTSVSVQGGGALGLLAGIAATAISTAAKSYVEVARACNHYTFKDLPTGKYSPAFGTDGEQMAGSKNFKVTLNSNSR